MQIWKRAVLVLVVLVSFGGVLSGCRGSDSDSPKEVVAKLRQQVADHSMEPRLSHDGLPSVTVGSVVLSIDPILVGPTAMSLVDDALVVADFSNDPALHIAYLTEDTVVTRLVSTGRLGQGPGEFSTVTTVHADYSARGRVWAYDSDLARLTLLDLRLLKDGKAPAIRVVDIKQSPTRTRRHLAHPARVAPLPNGGFAGTMRDSSAVVLAYYDSLGNEVSRAGKLVRAEDDVDADIAGRAYNNTPCVAGVGGDRIAVAYLDHGRLELYSTSGQVHGDAEVPFRFSLRIERNPFNGRQILGGPDSRTAYSACTASSKYIFALFAGKLKRAFKGSIGSARETEFVHVFNWSGELITVLKLDHLATAIAVDTASRLLYTGGITPEPYLRASRLPGLWGSRQ